jgi:hypothetical protein
MTTNKITCPRCNGTAISPTWGNDGCALCRSEKLIHPALAMQYRIQRVSPDKDEYNIDLGKKLCDEFINPEGDKQ